MPRMVQPARCNHVLVVEDDQDIRDTVQEVLEMEGYNVGTASNGKEGLEYLRSRSTAERPCFVLLDLMMPVMNGWEFLLIQRSDPELANIPVVICSAIADRAKFPGIVDYIRKPIDLEQLLKMISRHCFRVEV